MNSFINIVKKNYKELSFFCLFIIINCLFFNNIYINSPTLNFGKKYILLFILFLILQIVMVFLLYKLCNNKNYKIEKLFLIVAIIIGSIYLVSIPLGLVPDEKSHFGRSYEISLGHLVSDKNTNNIGGRVLPVEIEDNIAKTTDFKYTELFNNMTGKNSGQSKFIYYANTSLYSFVCYIPQAIGIFIGRMLNLPIVAIGYLGRIFNFMAWLFIMYMCIKYIPFLKKFVMFVALLPMTLQEAVSLSPDCLTIATAAGLLSFVLYMIYTKKDRMNKLEYWIMNILTILMSLLKIVYLPLCLLLFLIPADRFKDKKDKYIKIVSITLFVIIINFIWLKISSSYLVEFQAGVNSSEQVKYVITHPFQYLHTLFNSLSVYGENYLFNMVGRDLEWFNVNLSFIYPLISLLIIVLIIIKQNCLYKINIKLSEKLLFLFIFLSSLLLIFTSLYIQWTPVANKIINGIQGRYFLPLLFLLPILFLPIGKNKKTKKLDEKNLYLISFIIFQNIYAIMMIVTTHI